MSNKFFNIIQNKIEENGIEFKTEEDIAEQTLLQNEEENRKLDAKKKKILDIVASIENRIKIRVAKIEPNQLSINQDNIVDDMEKTMVLHSNVIDDIFDFQKILEEFKVVQNSLSCLLHHGYKFKNKLKIKGGKELETYIASDYTFNEVNIRIKQIQSLIERANNYSRLIDRKIGFLKEISQIQRAKYYKESKENV